MKNLLTDPDDFFSQIRRYTASVVTSITYGFRGATPDSFWARVSIDHVAEIMSESRLI